MNLWKLWGKLEEISRNSKMQRLVNRGNLFTSELYVAKNTDYKKFLFEAFFDIIGNFGRIEP